MTEERLRRKERKERRKEERNQEHKKVLEEYKTSSTYYDPEADEWNKVSYYQKLSNPTNYD